MLTSCYDPDSLCFASAGLNLCLHYCNEYMYFKLTFWNCAVSELCSVNDERFFLKSLKDHIPLIYVRLENFLATLYMRKDLKCILFKPSKASVYLAVNERN